MTNKVGRIHRHQLPSAPLDAGDVYECSCKQRFVVVPYGIIGLGWQPIFEDVIVEEDDNNEQPAE